MRIQRTIGDFLTDREYAWVKPGDTVAVAIDTMKGSSADCALVCDGSRLVGIFTVRDFVSRVAAQKLIPGEVRIESVMTPSPETLCVDDCVTWAINRMADSGFRNVPIVSSEGEVVANLDAHTVVGHLSEVCSELEDDPEAAGLWTDIGGAG